MIKRYFITGIIAAILILSGAAWFLTGSNLSLLPAKSSKPSAPHNVILISIGTLRADHIGIYGYERDTSPNLDRFAKENIFFEQAITQAPYTFSSQASLFTSQYPAVHGAVDDVSGSLASSKLTLAEVLKQAGYKTAGFTGGRPVSILFGMNQGFETFIDDRGSSFRNTIPLAVQWLKKHKGERFFLFVQGYDVHDLFHNPESFENMFDPDYNGVLHDDEKLDNNLAAYTIKKIKNEFLLVLEDETIPLKQQDIDHIIAHYDAAIRYTDLVIRQFFDTLRELGVYNNSIIVLHGDHGETLGELQERSSAEWERMFGHGVLYEENVHVPLIVKHPEFSSRTIVSQVQLIDLFPTIIDFLNIPLSRETKQHLQGKSLVPLIEGKLNELNEYTYGQRDLSTFIRTNQWKLISGKRGLELYNLKDNLKETRNVADQYPEIVEKLQQKLEEWNFINLKKRSELE